MTIDVRALSDLLAERLHLATVSLTPVSVRCACPVFRATSPGREPMFVKLSTRSAVTKTVAFLRFAATDCRLLPQLILADDMDFGGFAVLCLEWRDAATVNAEDMSERQFESFVNGCADLSEVLCRYHGVVDTGEDDSPDRQHALLLGYASRHPVMGRLIEPLLSVPKEERSYAGRRCVAIHGDFQPKNYGFDGDRLAAVFDFDSIRTGLACEDAAYAFTERIRKSELPRSVRQGLVSRFLQMVERSPWPREEWLIAVNHARLRIASRRLGNHPDAMFIAFDIARRDRLLQPLARALGGSGA